MSKLIAALFLLALFNTADAQSMCKENNAADCARTFAEHLSGMLNNTPRFVDRIGTVSAASEAGAVVLIHRADFTEKEFLASPFGFLSARDSYLSGIRESFAQNDCTEPGRELIDRGGSFKHTLLFSDGGTLDQFVTSECLSSAKKTQSSQSGLKCPSRSKPLAPEYPKDLMAAGVTGITVLVIVVDRCGVPTSATVERSSGNDTLDASAMKAVRTWRFDSYAPGGKFRVPVVFDPWK